MSKETLEYLNLNTLIGYTDKRGNAWHRSREIVEAQGREPNHYTGPVPIEDVRRRLFHWDVWETDGVRGVFPIIDEDGVRDVEVVDSTRKMLIRSDTRTTLGVPKKGYKVHTYDDALLKNVENILDAAGLAIGSAGILRGGGVGWVQIEMEDTIETKGVEFRPFLTAATSLDGSLSTTYKTGVTAVVCDNTLSAALGEGGGRVFRIKHSRNSEVKLAEAREALNIVHSVADDFARQVEELTAQTVTDAQWAEFVKRLTPISQGTSKRSDNMALTKRSQLNRLYNESPMVAPWRGNAYGVLAAVNTWAHHEQTVRGKSRAERNSTRMVMGEFDSLDATTLQLLAKVR